MKKLIFLFLVLGAFSSMANEIVCLKAKYSIPLTDFEVDSDFNSHHADYVYEKLLSCEGDIFSGDICYKGSPTAAIKILNHIDENLISAAGEYYMDIVKIVYRTQLRYTIVDGPNDYIVADNRIKACK